MAVTVGYALAFTDDVVSMREMHVPTTTPSTTLEETKVCWCVECSEVEDPTTPMAICSTLGVLTYEEQIPILCFKKFE